MGRIVQLKHSDVTELIFWNEKQNEAKKEATFAEQYSADTIASDGIMKHAVSGIYGVVTEYNIIRQKYIVALLHFKISENRIKHPETKIICDASDFNAYDMDTDKYKILHIFKSQVLSKINSMLEVSCHQSQAITIHNPTPIEVKYKISIEQTVSEPKVKYCLRVIRCETDIIKRKNLQSLGHNTLLSMSDSVAIVAEAIFAFGETEIEPVSDSDDETSDTCVSLDYLKTYLPFRQQGFAQLLTGMVAAIAVMANVDHFTVDAASDHTKKIFKNNFDSLKLGKLSDSSYWVYAVKSKSIIDNSQMKLWQAYQNIVEKMFGMHHRKDSRFQNKQKWQLTDFYWDIPYVQATNVQEEIEANQKALVQRFSNMMNPYIVPL